MINSLKTTITQFFLKKPLTMNSVASLGLISDAENIGHIGKWLNWFSQTDTLVGGTIPFDYIVTGGTLVGGIIIAYGLIRINKLVADEIKKRKKDPISPVQLCLIFTRLNYPDPTIAPYMWQPGTIFDDLDSTIVSDMRRSDYLFFPLHTMVVVDLSDPCGTKLRLMYENVPGMRIKTVRWSPVLTYFDTPIEINPGIDTWVVAVFSPTGRYKLTRYYELDLILRQNNGIPNDNSAILPYTPYDILPDVQVVTGLDKKPVEQINAHSVGLISDKQFIYGNHAEFIHQDTNG